MDELLIALQDCAEASTHEPDAETIKAAVKRITELEKRNEYLEKIFDRMLQLNIDRNAVCNDWYKQYRLVMRSDNGSEVNMIAVRRIWDAASEHNGVIAQLEAQLAAAEREAWNAAIDCVAAVIENVPYENQNAVAVAKQSAEVARTFKK